MLRWGTLLLVSFIGGCGGGGGSSDPASPASPYVASPESLSAEVNAGVITLSWSSVEGADGYHLYMAEEPGVTPGNYAAYSGGRWFSDVQSPFELTALDPGPVYHFTATAFAGETESAGSEEVFAIPRYMPVGDGSVIRDLSTGLEWKRCAEGQSWNGVDHFCAGPPTVFYDGAAIDILQPDGFRTPTRDELASIVFCSGNTPTYFPEGSSTCWASDEPSIVADVFPSTPTARSFQTSTRYPEFPDVTATINFQKGSIIGASTSGTALHVRLVRNN